MHRPGTLPETSEPALFPSCAAQLRPQAAALIIKVQAVSSTWTDWLTMDADSNQPGSQRGEIEMKKAKRIVAALALGAVSASSAMAEEGPKVRARPARQPRWRLQARSLSTQLG